MQTTVAANFDHTQAAPLSRPAASATPSGMQTVGHGIAAFVANEWDMIAGIALVIAGGIFAVVQVMDFVR